MGRQPEAEPGGGRRGLREAILDLASSNRKNLRPSAGQQTLSRRIHSLLNTSKWLHKLTSQQVAYYPPQYDLVQRKVEVYGRPLLPHTWHSFPQPFSVSSQVVWQDGCFSVSAEAKWDETRRGKDIVLSNNNTTVTRSNGNEWGGVLGSQCFTAGQHTFTFQIDKCQTDYVYVGLAYDNVDLNDNYNGRNIVLRAGDGSFRVFSSSQGCFGGYRSGDSIRVEVDMTEKTATFYKNDQLLCLAGGIAGPMRPFVSIGSRDVILTLQSHDAGSIFDVKNSAPSSPMLEIAVRTGLDLIFALLEKEDNSRIRQRMLKTALMAMQNLPPLAFFREADGLRDEALSSVAEFVQSVSSPDSSASKEERCLATQLLLELAVARGSLRFTLHVIESVDDACITIDERLLGTLRRIGDVDAVGEARIKGLFKEARAPQPDAEGKDQFESILGAVERSVKSGGLPEGQNKTVLRALILAQLERCARRLKTDQALLAPHCIEANAETFKLICSLLRAHPVSSAEQVSGGTAEEAISFSGYVPLALIRLLTINLRQAARQAARQTHRLELDAELLTDLRSVLLSLVEDSASRGTDSGLICRAQEEAVAALRAGTPVLFNDPAELVGLLDVMLQKRSEHVASPSEVQFMAMLLSYLAKPPVIWRVLTLSEDDTEAQEDEVAIKPEGNAACMRLFHCLLGHLKQHCMARISQTCKAGDEPSNVIPSACTDVLATAWHLQYACWTSATTNKSAALQLSIEMVESFTEHSLEVARLVAGSILEHHCASPAIFEEALQESAIGSLLPDVFAVVSQMPPDAGLLSKITELLLVLDTIASSLPGIAVASLSLKDEGSGKLVQGEDAQSGPCDGTLIGLRSQRSVGELVAESAHPYVMAGASAKRDVFSLQGATYLLVEFSQTCATHSKQEWVQVEDGFGNVLAGRFWGDKGWPLAPIMIPGETASVQGFSAPMFSIDCWEVHSNKAPANMESGSGNSDTVVPLYLPDSVVFTQISFDPLSLPESASQKLSVTMGTETRMLTGGDDSDLPAIPLCTVNPNITFAYSSTEAGAAPSEDSDANGDAVTTAPKGWKALACCIVLASGTEPHWLVEVLRLLSCVSAQLAGMLVTGSPAREAEVMCKQWLTSDLLKLGQLRDDEAPSEDVVNEGFSLPQRPHPLRHHPALDRLEKACTAAMLHHLNLLETVRAHGEEPWGDETSGLIPILRRVGVCSNKVRRLVMQQRDQMMAVQSESVIAGVKDVSSYDELVKPYIERAVLLMRFVPAYGRQNNPNSPSKVRPRAPMSLSGPTPVDGDKINLSPTQRWQRAALRVVGEKSPVKQHAALRVVGEKSAAKRKLIVNDAAAEEDPGSLNSAGEKPQSQVGERPMAASSYPDSSESAVSPWMSLLPWFRVHHAYWKVKHRTVKQEEVVVDHVQKFLVSEITADLVSDSMRSRELRATEVEAGLTCLTKLFKGMHTRVGRAEVLQALLVSNWAMRHYLEDIRASTAPALGRVRALFNDMGRCLLDVLKGHSSSCQLRGYAANALAMLYDASDLDYLSLIGLPAVLEDFVETSGASLQLAGLWPSPELSSNSLSVKQVPFPNGAMWHGVFHEGGGEKEMAMCLSVNKNSVSGTGHWGKTSFVIRGEMVDASKIDLEAVHQDGSTTTLKAQVVGKKMEGVWVHGLDPAGSFCVHRTMRAPLPPSAFSRVNRSYIRFAGRSIVFTGTNQIGVVQAERPLTAQNTYFEVQVLDKGSDCAIAVGVAHRDYPLDQMPGWRNGSIAYHMDDGKLFFQRGQGARFGDKCGQGDVVGCGLELSKKGDSVVSVYWTKNRELVGRELCASSLQLPLYASVALHSQGEKVLLFEAQPPPSLSKHSIEFINSNGHLVRLGTDRNFTHLYYCGQRVGVGRLPGSDGTCGPNNGPQCSACEIFQEFVASRGGDPPAFGEGAAVAEGTSKESVEDSGASGGVDLLKMELSAQHATACQAVWRLLRIMLLQVTDQSAFVNGKLALGLWNTVLQAINSLAMQAGRQDRLADERRSSCVTVSGRQCYDEDKLVVSSSTQEVGNLESADHSLSWTSSCMNKKNMHWIQFTMRNAVALSYIGIVLNKDDSELCPRDVQIMAGEDEASLRVIQEVQVNPSDLNDGPNEIVLLHEPEEAFQIYRVCLEGPEMNVRARGLVVRGVVVRDKWSSTGDAEEANIIKRVEVSTNKYAKRFLSDGRPDTFWQSDGRSGQHWIRLYVEPDAVVTGLAIQVHAGDGNYCPSLVDVLVGDTPATVKRIRTCSLSPSGNQRCVLLEKCKQNYNIVQVNVRENNGGCDCKVRGLFLSGHFAPKRASAGGGTSASLLQDLLSTAYAASRSSVAAGSGTSGARKEWVTQLLRLLVLPCYNEQTRTKALSVLLRLCHVWGAQECLHSHPQLIESLLDVLAHSSAASSVMRPLSLRHWTPLRGLHSKLVKTIADLLCSPAWSDPVLAALKRSLSLLVDTYTPHQTEECTGRHDFVELWWSAPEGGKEILSSSKRAACESDDWSSRPTKDSKPCMVLCGASAPEPRRMLLYMSGPKGDISQARSYRIDSFEAPGMHVWLRPLPAPGRAHATPERHSLYDLVCSARGKGCTMLVQSLELLLMVMKGEASGTASGQFNGATLPTDNQWFVRVGRITAEGHELDSDEWQLLRGSIMQSRQSVPASYPSPSAMTLPAVLVMGEVSLRPVMGNAHREIFELAMHALSRISLEPSVQQPLGLRVLRSRLLRGIQMMLQVPQCVAWLLSENCVEQRQALLQLGSQNVPAPLNLSIEDLVAKSYFLCHQIGRELDTLPEASNSPDLSASHHGRGKTGPAGAVLSEAQVTSHEIVLAGQSDSVIPVSMGSSPAKRGKLQPEQAFSSQDISESPTAEMPEDACTDRDDSEVELSSSRLVMDTCPTETLLYMDPTNDRKRPTHLQHWQRKLGRLRASKLLADATTTEDSLSIYYARLSLLGIMQSTSREALSLDVETFATLLRRLFRTVRPEMTGADWQQRLKQQVLRSQLGRDLQSEAGREAVMRLAAHCSRLLDSMALRAIAFSETGKSRVKRVCIETQHKYSACTGVCMRVHMPGAHALKVTLDPRCCTKRGRDVLTLFSDSAMKEVVGVPYHGPQGPQNWPAVPIVRGNSLVLHFESDDGPSEWGYRLKLQPLDADERPCTIPSFWVESVAGLPSAASGKQDLSVHHDSSEALCDGLMLTFDRGVCGMQSSPSPARHGGRSSLKISSSAGKYSYQASSAWKPLLLPKITSFTLQTKTSSSGGSGEAGAMPIEYRILVEIASTGQGDETQGSTGDNLLGAFATDEAGEQGGVVGTSDSAFVCWLITALCSPSQGLVHSCAAPKDVVAGVLKGMVSSCLRAVMSLPMSLKASMLRSLAIVVRGLDMQTCSFDRGTLNSIRALREAAIAQHSVEQSLVGSQRAHFSPYLQALVEVVAGIDVGPVQDFAMMSRHELMRAIETVDGLPGTALCRAVLAGNQEQASWCLCRGGRPETACAERLVQSYASPQYALHYASYGGHDKLVALLFENRADVLCTDGDGNQPLAWAAARGFVSTVEELLKVGADPRHRNNMGKTALSMALQASGTQMDTSPASKRIDHRGVVSLLEGLDPDSIVNNIPGIVASFQAGLGMAPLPGPDTIPDIHPHPIQRTQRTTEWRCDGCNAPGRGPRFRSSGTGCDFDMCQVCWDAARHFTWADARTELPNAAGDPSGTLISMLAVAASSPNPLPDAWQHTNWMPSSAHRRNTRHCGFPYLHFDGSNMLQSSAPIKVGCVVLVLRVSRPTGEQAMSIIDIGPREITSAEPRTAVSLQPRSSRTDGEDTAEISEMHTTRVGAVSAAAAVPSHMPRDRDRDSPFPRIREYRRNVPSSRSTSAAAGQSDNNLPGPAFPGPDTATSASSTSARTSVRAGRGVRREGADVSAGANPRRCRALETAFTPAGAPAPTGGVDKCEGDSEASDTPPGRDAHAGGSSTRGVGRRPERVRPRNDVSARATDSVRVAGSCADRSGMGSRPPEYEGATAVAASSQGNSSRGHDGPGLSSSGLADCGRDSSEPASALVNQDQPQLAISCAGRTGAHSESSSSDTVPSRVLASVDPKSVPVDVGLGAQDSLEAIPTSLSTGRGSFASWANIWRADSTEGDAVAVKNDADMSKAFDGRWQVLVLESKYEVQGHLHLMGSRDGRKKCRGDIAEVLVFERGLSSLQRESVTKHLGKKYRLDASEPPSAATKIPKEMLVMRMRELYAAAPRDARLEIPRWLDRYIKCFQVVDSLITSSPLPSWFTREIEPGGSEPWSPSTAHTAEAGAGAPGHVVEPLFDLSRCGAGANLDAARSRVEFTGMASVLLTDAIPPEGLHVMEFDVHGRDQCLVGVATPDVDVDTYLGHKRGGYGFFASEGTLKVDGDWKGGHGLVKYKRGDKVGVHVDMSRRTLQFSISKWEVDNETGQGRWNLTLLERIVEGLPSVLHFAVGGAAGGELSIAGGSTSASAGEERLASFEMLREGGHDNANWPAELDAQLVAFLNEKASERRKHPRNIRSADLLGPGNGETISLGDPEVLPPAPRKPLSDAHSADDESDVGTDKERQSPSPTRDARKETVPSAGESSDSEAWWTESAGEAGDVVCDHTAASDYVVYQHRRAASFGGARSAAAVRARFVVLKKLESLVAATIPLVDLRGARDPDSAAGRLVTIKGRLFEATKMHVWDAAIRLTQDRKEDIPSVTVYRGAAAELRRSQGVRDWQGTVFGQLFAVLEDTPLLRSRSKGKGMMAWQVAFAGEGGDDYGGLFRESIREMAADLQSAATGLFIPVPNSRNAMGFNRDTFVPNPACTSALHLRHYRFIGKLMGSGMRTSNPVGLDLPPLVWKRFLGEDVNVRDLAGIDERWVRAVESIRTQTSAAAWPSLASSSIAAIAGGVPHGGVSSPGQGIGGDHCVRLVWACRSAGGHVVELIKGGLTKSVDFEERAEYVRLAVQARISEFDKAVGAMRRGLSSNVPTFILPLLTHKELMVRVCGEVSVDLDILKSIVKNKLDGGEGDPRMAWLWQTLEEFTNEERQQFLGFVWGRERLPRDTSGLQLEVRTQASHGDEHLPSSHTCFNALDMPRYSSLQVLRDKLRYAIAHCKAIDTDFAARVGVGEDVEPDGEEEGDVDADSDVSESSQGSDREAVTEFEEQLDSTCRMS